MEIPASLVALLSNLVGFTAFLSANPLLLGLQAAIVSGAAFLVFLVFWATRDILHRTRSVTIQLLSIALVALFPIAGFFLYLLMRPRQALEEKEMAEGVKEILDLLQKREKELTSVKDKAREKAGTRETKNHKRKAQNATLSQVTERSAA
jgi:hypothetical protein